MMLRSVAVISLLALAACDMPPEGTGTEDIALFDAAVASVGCQMIGESDYLPVELQTGLSREQLLAMIQYKINAGQAERLPKGGVKFNSGACA